jgi:hypothetical protein
MTKLRFLYPLAFFILVLQSCSDIFEKDLTKKSVNVLAPSDGSMLSNATVTFWWDSLPGATRYTVQVVKPSFTNTQTLILDSNIMGNRLFLSMPPGNYEWRIKATNTSSSTSFQQFSFSIDSNLNIANQTVLLITPANNIVLNRHSIDFQWSQIFNATDYRFEIYNSSNTLLYQNATLTTNAISYGPLVDGAYTWRVRAQNTYGTSAYTTFSFIIDSTIPPTPSNFFANVRSFPSDSFSLRWTRGMPTTGISYYDSLLIYSDSTQGVVVRSLVITSSSPVIYEDSLPRGSYYAKVATKDNAGNTSAFTALLKFILP